VSDTLLSKTIASTATLKIANIHSFDLFYTPIEERFERITRIARRAHHAPVAAISLLPMAQWLIGGRLGRLRLPRDPAICKLRSGRIRRHDRRHARRSARRGCPS
jgi:hypothetical protein